MTTYWELYVAYVHKCLEDNHKNNIDPHHYEMEWNHFLPKCVFGDWPIGHYLTLRQHAIASALQSLAFNRNCMCSWHKKHLPELLLEVAWPIFCEASRKRAKKSHVEKDELGRSVLGIKCAEIINCEKDELGRSINSVKGAAKANAEKDELGRSVNAVKGAEKLNAEKDELGRSVNAVKGAEKLNAEKDEFGRSVNALKVHMEKDELGRSVHALKAGKAGALKKRRPVKLTRVKDGEVFIFPSTLLAAETLKISGGNIVNVCKGKRKIVSGYTAIYLDT